MNDSIWTWFSGTPIHEQPGVYGEKGNASVNHVPGGRERAIGWYDSSNEELWLFGGSGYGNGSTKGTFILAAISTPNLLNIADQDV